MSLAKSDIVASVLHLPDQHDVGDTSRNKLAGIEFAYRYILQFS